MTVSDLIKNKDYDYIEWRIMNPDRTSDMLFGITSSKNGKLISLDGDSYCEDTEIISYKEWNNPDEEIQNGLTIIFEVEWI